MSKKCKACLCWKGKEGTSPSRMYAQLIMTVALVPLNTVNYYGMAVRQHSELYAMKKSAAVVVHHCSDAPTMEERHNYCQRGSDS